MEKLVLRKEVSGETVVQTFPSILMQAKLEAAREGQRHFQGYFPHGRKSSM